MNELEFNLIDNEAIDLEVDNKVVEVTPPLEDLNITPTKEVQTFKSSKYGYDNVTAQAIPDDYIIPSGTKTITESGVHNVKEYENANVDIYVPTLGTKTITTNGTYKASDDNLGGYSEVSVETSGADLNDYFTNTIKSGTSTVGGYIYSLKSVMPPTTVDGTSLMYAYGGFQGESIDLSELDTSAVTTMDSMFYQARAKTIDLTGIDTSNVTTMRMMFANNNQLKTVIGLDDIDTSNVTDTAAMFRYCSSLETLDISGMDLGSVTNITNMFNYASSLKNVTFGYNLGKSFPADATPSMAAPTVLSFKEASGLTHDSAVNIINSLYDISNITDVPQWVTFSNLTFNTLTQAEKDIAIAKGWEVKR